MTLQLKKRWIQISSAPCTMASRSKQRSQVPLGSKFRLRHTPEIADGNLTGTHSSVWCTIKNYLALVWMVDERQRKECKRQIRTFDNIWWYYWYKIVSLDIALPVPWREAHIRIRNATNLTSGGWFDKLDPYTIVRFRGSKEDLKLPNTPERAQCQPRNKRSGSINTHYKMERFLSK